MLQIKHREIEFRSSYLRLMNECEWKKSEKCFIEKLLK